MKKYPILLTGLAFAALAHAKEWKPLGVRSVSKGNTIFTSIVLDEGSLEWLPKNWRKNNRRPQVSKKKTKGNPLGLTLRGGEVQQLID